MSAAADANGGPPACEQVWICPLPHGHRQATGRDARGRKQSRCHPTWRAARDETKFDRMPAFGAVLPRICARMKRDLAAPVGERVLRHAVIAAIARQRLVRPDDLAQSPRGREGAGTDAAISRQEWRRA